MSVQSATLSLPADRTRVLSTLGGVGVAAGLLFASMSMWQHAAGLESGSSGPAYALNQGGFAVAMVGYVAVLLGVHLARPGGDGRTARTFTALIAAAWLAFIASMAVEAVTTAAPADDILGPIGGLAQGIGLVGVGVLTVGARRWSGWRRFWPLGLAAVYVGALFVPAIAGVEPSALAETFWALGYSGLGLALMAESGRERFSRGQYVLGTVVAVAAIAIASVVTFSTSPASSVAPERMSGTVGSVQTGPVYGSADVLERHGQPGGPTFGSADSLERQSESGGPTFGSADSLERQSD